VSISSELYTALKSLVSNRVDPITFGQSGTTPVWPAIRYTIISAAPIVSLDGDDGDETADLRIQLDIVTLTYPATQTLRAQVMAAMKSSFGNVMVWDGEFNSYDAETKTYMCQMDYLFYPSSGDSSPP